MTGEMLCNGGRCCVRICFFQVVRVNPENRRTGRNAVFVRLDRDFYKDGAELWAAEFVGILCRAGP